MFVEKVTFPSGSLTLEGVLQYPEDERCDRAVVLFSPHPKLGGDMENNVVRALADHLPELGYVTLRFNYRGIGGSRSSAPGVSRYDFWDALDKAGTFEEIVEDGLAAVRYARGLGQLHRLFLAGYSFGARILEDVAAAVSPDGIAALAPPVRFYRFSALAGLTVPKFLVWGDGDFTGSREEAAAFAATVAEPKRVVWLDGRDHFFRGCERQVAELVGDAFADA